MNDTVELAKKAGFLSRLAFQLEPELAKLEKLLRQKFIAELGEPVWWHHEDENGEHIFMNMPFNLPDETPLYILPKE